MLEPWIKVEFADFQQAAQCLPLGTMFAYPVVWIAANCSVEKRVIFCIEVRSRLERSFALILLDGGVHDFCFTVTVLPSINY